MKLKITTTSFILAGVLLLSSCGGNNSTSDTSTNATNENAQTNTEENTADTSENTATNEDTTITIWNAGLTDSDDNGIIPSEEIPFNKYNEEFKAAHPGVELEISRYNMDQMYQLITAATMSNDLPDVMILWAGSSTNDFSEQLLSLDDYITQEEIEQYSALEICYKDFNQENNLQALPLALTTYNFFYNKETFANAGIEEEPKTWEEFLDVCQKLKDNGVVPFLTESASGYHETWAISEFLADKLGPEGVSTIGTDEFKFNSPEFIDSYKAWSQLFELGYVNEDFETASDTVLDEMFLNGKGAMRIGGSWGEKGIYDLMGDNVDTFPIPTVSKDAPYQDIIISQPGLNVAVFNTTDTPELSVEYIKTITGAQLQGEALTIFADLPSHKASDTTQVSNPLAIESIEWLKSYDTAIGFDSLIPAPAANDFYKNCVLVNSGKMTIEEFAQLLDESVATNQ